MECSPELLGGVVCGDEVEPAPPTASIACAASRSIACLGVKPIDRGDRFPLQRICLLKGLYKNEALHRKELHMNESKACPVD